MKKCISIVLFISILSIIFTGCSSKTNENVLKIGATPVPHAQILNYIKDDLKKEGIELKIIEFIDYVKPNLALADGEIDANFFQHAPYMEDFADKHNIDIVSLGNIHVEPLGLYSNKIKSIDELKDGAVIAIPNDASNGGRALILLQENDIIKLSEDAGLLATEKDIIYNPKKLIFKALESAQLPRVLQDVDGAVINGNYALEANLVPTRDAVILEGANSPYSNIITVRKGDENNETLKKLLSLLQSKKMKKFIEENYNGGVVQLFNKS